MDQETVLETREICLNRAVEVVMDKHTGQRTDVKVYNQEILTLATSFEEWCLRKLVIRPVVQTQQVPVAQTQKQQQQPPIKETQTVVEPVAQDVQPVAQEPPINTSPMQDQIGAQREVREQFAEDFAIDKFKQEPGEKLAIQKGLGFSLKK